MDIQEAVKVIREHLSAELAEQVLDALDVPVPQSGGVTYASTFHVLTQIEVSFDVAAWGEAEAEEMVKMAIKAKPVLYGDFGEEVYGRVTKNIKIKGTVENMPDIGDDPLMDLSDSYGR